MARRFQPGRHDGDLLFFTAAADRRRSGGPTGSAAAWRPFVRGDIHEHRMNCEHSMMTTPEGLAVIGPVLDRHLAHQQSSQERKGDEQSLR
jgi:thioesterase domain-containing protein